ncbi:MAG: putative acyl-CoA dehydrogenase [Acidimicrobiales bacterium]|nr:putative acyl-CoA dehydrogenase [Acidimicrobiales bacterium]
MSDTITNTSSDLDAYRQQMRDWLAANLPARDPHAGLRAAHEISAEQLAADRALQKKVYEAGYVGITWPTEYGGQGLSGQHQQIWNEESRAYAVPAPGGIASGVTMGIVAPTLLAHANEEQKRSWLPKILRGDELWVQLLSEPGAGSDLAGILTRATQDGESWILQGTKVWSSGAMSADFGVCLARTDWDAPKHRGLTWFKVPLRDPRVTVRPVREINGSAEFCEEFLDDVVVADDMRIGELNEGWAIANSMLGFERGASRDPGAVRPKGGGIRPIAPDLVEIARSRATLTHGHVRQLIAKAHANDVMHELLTARVVSSITKRISNPSAASYIKLGHGILQPLRACAAMEIAGRTGIAWSADVHAHGETAATNYLNGRIMAIAGGSNQIQRNIISERLLGLPREPNFDTNKPFREVLRTARNWGTKGE